MQVMESGPPTLRVWVHPKGSGIRIREVLNAHGGAVFGASVQVTVPGKLTGRLRERKQFKTRADAETWAENQYRGYRKQGEDFFALTDEERREVATYLPQLRKHGVKLSEAVRFTIKRMRPEMTGRTVRQIVTELVQSKEQRFNRGDLRERSYHDFRQRSERLAQAFEGRIAAEITGQDLKTWLNGLRQGARTNKNYLAITSETFRYALQKRYVSFSPIEDLTDVDRKELCGRDGEAKEPSILTPAEAERLITAAAAHPKLDLLPVVALGLFCGLRTEELKRLEWQNIRLTDSSPVVTVTAKIAKKRRIRHVEIPANGVQWLTLSRTRKGLIAGGTTAHGYRIRFQKLLRLAGFSKEDDRGKWHSSWETNAMRHSFGSYHYALHGNPLETSRLLGHKASDQVLFDHYRALATKAHAEAFFSIMPAPQVKKVIRFA